MSSPAAIVIGVGPAPGGGSGSGDMLAATWDSDANGAIDVAKGGTNATSAASARTSLGAAASGANNDITSLGGLTSPVDVTVGGTGAATAAGARTNLGLGTLATQSGTFSGTHSGTSSGTNTGDQTISDATISVTDITTNNVSTSAHGFAPKAPNDATKFLDGTGAYSTPLSTGLGYLRVVDDFIGAGALLGVASSGTAASAAFAGNAVAGRPGILSLQTGTTTTGKAQYGYGVTSGTAPSAIQFGDGLTEIEIEFLLPAVSSGTDTYTVHIGFGDNVGGGTPTDGAFLRYNDSVNSGKFQFVTRSNNVETATDTGITATAGQWYKAKISVNAGGTSVDCFLVLDKAAYGTAVATNTLNIPTGATRATGVQVAIVKSAGTTSVSLNIDIVITTITLTTSR